MFEGDTQPISTYINPDVLIEWQGTNGAVTGNIKHVENNKLFGAGENKGNYFPFKLDDSYKGKPITVRRTSDSKSEKTSIDTEWILRLPDKTNTKYQITSENTEIANLSFTGAVLAENSELNVTIEKIKETDIPQDANKSACAINQKAIEVVKSGNNYTVRASLKSMQEYTSTDSKQKDKPYKWFGLIVNTGEKDIKSVSIDNYKFKDTDVKEAASVKADAGKFVLWLKAESVKKTPSSFTLKVSGKADTKIVIAFEDTDADG